MILPALVCLFQLVAADVPWWESNILYEIYPRSFLDSDGDGNGDLKGVISHVPYLHDLGIGSVWLCPIFVSPMKDTGYDISDFRKVDPLFGTDADLKDLINEIHKNGMKLLLDFVPNHTSDEHPWFNASRYKEDGKEDYYVWKDPKGWNGSTPLPPNNWMSVERAREAWTYDNVRKQFYLHQFASYQPDLNYRNKQVLYEMQNIMKFWFDNGIDGFRVDAMAYLVEDADFRDENEKPNCRGAPSYSCLIHNYTLDLPETYQVMKEFDDFLKQYDGNSSKHLFLEDYASLEASMKYNQPHTSPFNFELVMYFGKETNASQLKTIIDSYMAKLPNESWPNWVIGNHDVSRVGSRMGPEMIDILNMMILLLPGTSITYYGEEIGMLDTYIRKNRLVDTAGRDPERTPMQWSLKKNAGFSNASTTWLPVNPNYYKINVENETKNENSHLNKYKRLVEVRKNFIGSKDLKTTTFGDWVFAFKRKKGNHEYYVVINLNDIEESMILKTMFDKIPRTLYVHTPSQNAMYNVGDKVDTSSNITIYPRSAIGLTECNKNKNNCYI